MVFYYLVYREAAEHATRKVVALTVGTRRLDSLDGVETLSDLMHKPAIPVKRVHFRGWLLSPVPELSCGRDGGEKPRKDETLGETLARMKSGDCLKDAVERGLGTELRSNNNKPARGESYSDRGSTDSSAKSDSLHGRVEISPSLAGGDGSRSRKARSASFCENQKSAEMAEKTQPSNDQAAGRPDVMKFPSFRSVAANGGGGESVKGCMRVETLERSLNSVKSDEFEKRAHFHKLRSRSRSSARESRVTFGMIEIRQYSRVLGDNPACSSSPPISLGWKYSSKSTVLLVDDYELGREPRRTYHELRMPMKQRERMLRVLGYSTRELIEADQQRKMDQMMRERTISMLKYRRVEETVEMAKGLFHLRAQKAPTANSGA